MGEVIPFFRLPQLYERCARPLTASWREPWCESPAVTVSRSMTTGRLNLSSLPRWDWSHTNSGTLEAATRAIAHVVREWALHRVTFSHVERLEYARRLANVSRATVYRARRKMDTPGALLMCELKRDRVRWSLGVLDDCMQEWRDELAALFCAYPPAEQMDLLHARALRNTLCALA